MWWNFRCFERKFLKVFLVQRTQTTRSSSPGTSSILSKTTVWNQTGNIHIPVCIGISTSLVINIVNLPTPAVILPVCNYLLISSFSKVNWARTAIGYRTLQCRVWLLPDCNVRGERSHGNRAMQTWTWAHRDIAFAMQYKGDRTSNSSQPSHIPLEAQPSKFINILINKNIYIICK